MHGMTLKDVRLDIFPEETSATSIIVLNHPDSLLVIDPRKTKTSCGPGTSFQGRAIIVSSPESCHWGDNQFCKLRSPFRGAFMYIPLWTLEELLAIPEQFKRNSSDDAITNRYRMVGPVFGHIFRDCHGFKIVIDLNIAATRKLGAFQAEKIAFGKCLGMISFDSDQPNSSLIGFRMADTNSNVCFEEYTLTILSDLMRDHLSANYVDRLWDRIIKYENHCGWNIFESYCRYILVGNTPILFEARELTSAKDAMVSITLGGCHSVQLVNTAEKSLVGHALGKPNVLFYSAKPNFPQFIFVYADSDNRVHVIHATVSQTHNVPTDLVRNLDEEAKISNADGVFLYFLVIDLNYDKFDLIEETGWTGLAKNVSVLSVQVPRPSMCPCVHASIEQIMRKQM